MSNHEKTGGPAFPKAGLDPWNAAKSVQTGMTLRDYFAAAALQAIVSNEAHIQRLSRAYVEDPRSSAECIAYEAYVLADAMLAARAEEQ